MGRCLRCAEAQRKAGRQEPDIEWETYQGETSRSLVSRSREHYADYHTAMKKLPPGRAGARAGGGEGGQGGQGEEVVQGEQEEGTSWMADHTRSHHDGEISADPREDYDFIEVGQFRKPLQRQLEEAVRIKTIMKQGFILLGQGPKARKVKT